MLAKLVDIFKLRIGVLMALTALAGYTVTPGQPLAASHIVLLALFVLLASASAGAFNQFVEREQDALMARTRKRPFVTGAMTASPIWLVLIAFLLLLAVGLASWLFNYTVAFYVFMGAFFYGVVYTLWLKRRTAMNIVIGGISGSFAVLAGASAADPGLNEISLSFALILFLWTPPHFWALAIALHDDYAAAKVPMLPVVKGDRYTANAIFINVILLTIASVAPVFYGLHWIYLLGALIGGAFFLYKSILLIQNPSKKTAMACFFSSLFQLTLVLFCAILDVQLLG